MEDGNVRAAAAPSRKTGLGAAVIGCVREFVRRAGRCWRVRATVAAVFALTACGRSTALVEGLGFGIGSGKLLPGEHTYVGVPLEAQRDSTCSGRITGARVLQHDAGVATDVRAVDRNEGTEHATIGGGSEKDLPVRPRPVTDAVLMPGRDQRWYLLVVLSAAHPGTYNAHGVHVDYVCGGQTGAVDYPLIDMTLTVVASR